MSRLVAEPEMRWQRPPGSTRQLALLILVAVVAICAIGRAARLQMQVARFVLWANAAGEQGQGVVMALGHGPPQEQASRPARLRPHTPPTWQQEREWARADLRELCNQARHVARVLESASERSPGAREPAPAALSGARRPGPSPAATARHGGQMAILAGLSRAVQEEARITADLDRARGLTDVLAARRKTAALGDCVARATSMAREQHAGRSGVRRAGLGRDVHAIGHARPVCSARVDTTRRVKRREPGPSQPGRPQSPSASAPASRAVPLP